MNQSPREPGVAVDSVARFLTRVRSALIPRFGHGVRVVSNRETGTNFFTDNAGPVAPSMGRSVPALPLLQDRLETPTHWLAIEVDADLEGDDERIGHVSIKAYHGLAADPDKQLLFRAEWDPRQPRSLKHGQPHWHFHDATAREDDDGNDLRALEDEEFASAALDMHKHLHYAMGVVCTDVSWDAQPGLPNDETLLRWIVGTIDYILSEMLGVVKGSKPVRQF